MQLTERKQLFEDAVRFSRPERLPLFANFFTWKIIDSDYTLRQALYDWDIMYEIVSAFHERYGFDSYMDLGTRNPFALTSSMGGNMYEIDDERQNLYIQDFTLMKEDEYPQLAADPIKYLWSVCFPRKCADAGGGDALEKFRGAIDEYNKLTAFTSRITEQFRVGYQVPRMSGAQFLHAFEMLFNFLRGIHGTATDMRRRKGELMEACDAVNRVYHQAVIDAIPSEQRRSDVAFDLNSALLGHSIMSFKQFGEIYWPFLKKAIGEAAKAGKTIMIFSEAYLSPLADYFADIPKGAVAVHVEQDDIFALRKKLPNITLAGGMPADLLGGAGVEECLDYAKKLIEEMEGARGGYIFSQNKMMSYACDAKRENLLAVNNFVRNYSFERNTSLT